MTEQSQPYNVGAIRELLLEAFSAEELRRFCDDRPLFQPVVRRFGPGLGLDDMVDRVLEYCRTRLLWVDLLAQVKEIRPGQYARFEPDLFIADTQGPQGRQPQPSTSDILTITRPIYLDLIRIPAGEFLMGSVAARDIYAWEDEFPPHRVRVPEFHMGKYPVTNRQYQAFVKATGARAPSEWESGEIPWGKENHPVADISWNQAVSFCTWLSEETGQPFRLPTEAEWEKAARGTDGRIWPWGDEPPDESRCTFGRQAHEETTSIGRYSPQGDSFYGCADMAGNVWEWCHSQYKPYPYRAGDGREGDSGGWPRVLRGGSLWDEPAEVRCACRHFTPDVGYPILGFRVARGPLEGAR